MKEILRDGHAPGEQVFHWRHADGTRQALEKRGARQRRRPGELDYGPGAFQVAVHLPDRGPDSRVGRPAQQPRRSVLARRRPERLDEQDLDEAREHEVAARSPFTRFLADQPTRIESRSTPRTWTSDGNSETRSAESGESKTNYRRATDVGPSAARAVADFARRRDVTSGRCVGPHRLEARQGEAGRGRQEHEVACSSVRAGGRRPRTGSALEHRAEAWLAKRGVANTPAAGAADSLREHRARLKERDDFPERIVHLWTLTKEIWTPHGGRSSGNGTKHVNT